MPTKRTLRPARAKEESPTTPNLPHSGGRYAKFADHIDAFVTGFADYANFLMRFCRTETPAGVVISGIFRKSSRDFR